MRDVDETRERRPRRYKSPWSSFITGIVFAGAFGTFWFFNQSAWWLIFPIIFLGVLPMVNGLRRVLSTPSRRRMEKKSAEQLETELEQHILQAAHDQGGRLTAAGAALRASIPVKEAARVLERMAKEGHAVMNITGSGAIEYEFTDFLPDPDRQKLT
jgi:hypothetical protein